MTNISASRLTSPQACNSTTGHEFGRLSSRQAVAAVLLVAAVAALAVTSLIQSHQQATAQSAIVAAPAPLMGAMSVPFDSGAVGPFAFGHVEFDWHPAAAGGVPGFDSWPPGSRR